MKLMMRCKELHKADKSVHVVLPDQLNREDTEAKISVVRTGYVLGGCLISLQEV